jgi:predicted nucleotide-binding protein
VPSEEHDSYAYRWENSSAAHSNLRRLDEDCAVTEKRTEESSHQARKAPPEKAMAFLQGQLNKGRDLLASAEFSHATYEAWHMATQHCIEKVFGSQSVEVMTWLTVPYWVHKNVDHLLLKTQKLEGLIDILKVDVQLSEGLPANISPAVSPEAAGDRIFIVHGHDEGILQGVARFLETLKQNVIILKEKPGKGKTIIEKFEDHAKDVGFVVVLLTSDDRGGPRDTKYKDQQARARQNVVFELGYFIGRLGRNRVCALRVPDVEIPSDYSGVQYITLDSSRTWQLELAREMRAAGLNIDMNLAFL